MDEQCQQNTDEVESQLSYRTKSSLRKGSSNKAECTDCCEIFHDCHYNPHNNFIGLFEQIHKAADLIFYGYHGDTDEYGKGDDLEHVVRCHGIENICRNNVDQCVIDCLFNRFTGFPTFKS